MRKIVSMMSVSLDGFIEGPNREIDWHRVNTEMLRHFNEEIREFGALLSGRVTYELMAEYWPTADKDPGIGPEMAEFAAIWRNMPKVVFSRTLKHADRHTTVVREVVPRRSGRSRRSRAATSGSAAPISPRRSCGTTSWTSSGCTSTPC